MTLPQNTLRQLQTPNVGVQVLPKLELPPWPEKIVKIDPEGVRKYKEAEQRVLAQYTERLTNAIRGIAT